jgi:hypothetical protein
VSTKDASFINPYPCQNIGDEERERGREGEREEREEEVRGRRGREGEGAGE